MDRGLRRLASQWLDEGRPAVVVSVAGVRGSAPREAGARMLVSPSECVGTIGGGHLEWRAIAAARSRLAAPHELQPPSRITFALGPSLGQCCGGVVELDLEPLGEDALRRWPPGEPRLRVQLHGAGHVGRAVAALLSTLPVEVDWIDEREDAFPASNGDPAGGDGRVSRQPTDDAAHEVRLAAPGTCFLVMTHRHDLDLRIVEAVLRRDDFAFLGLIGSVTKRERFRHRLAEQGCTPLQLERLQCPVGVPGIEGKEPAFIAVAIVAQLLTLGSGSGSPRVGPKGRPGAGPS